MKKLNNIVYFAVLICTGLLLNIGASAALDQSAMEQQESPPAETSKYDLSHIDESNIKYSGGQAVLSGNAQAYFVGYKKSRHCYTLTDVIACQFSGPLKILLVYKDEKKFFDLEAADDGVCYTGRRGMFCDVQDDFDIEDVLRSPADENWLAPGNGIYSLEFGPTKGYWRCMSGTQYELCSVIGPIRIDLIHDGTASAYDIGEDMHAFCYAGRLGSFCDVYDEAGD